ncbi:hypothetical protein NDU88_002710 [Pleurodeles waltl]|uniref:Uncharacterized protein n=1 Tax=Pleurodeles waltl TaxID=8319 RepID=A0AAV7QCJ6_PLEWA|nr:hypothetical protein NDU88_002710 [Pleurodeles waltl]
MTPRDRIRKCVPTPEFPGSPELTEEMMRESGGQWKRAAVEVRRVRTLTSGVALRGVTGSIPGRGSTSRGTSPGRRRELVAAKEGGEILSSPCSLEEHVLPDKSATIFQKWGRGDTILNTVGPGEVREDSLSLQTMVIKGEFPSEGSDSRCQGGIRENPDPDNITRKNEKADLSCTTAESYSLTEEHKT